MTGQYKGIYDIMCTRMKRPKTMFGEWLTGVVEGHSLKVVAPPDQPDRRMKTWSDRLSIAMGGDEEYDSSLRRIANGTNTPRAHKTYQIGRGLRVAGLTWCSGTLALMRNPKTFRDLLAVIDIASSDKSAHPFCVEWLRRADELTMVEPRTWGPKDEEYAVFLRASLANFTQELNSVFDDAFAEYERRGLTNAHGLLGIAYQVVTGEQSGSDAVIAMYGLVNIWLGMKFEPYDSGFGFPDMLQRHINAEQNRTVPTAPITLRA